MKQIIQFLYKGTTSASLQIPMFTNPMVSDNL